MVQAAGKIILAIESSCDDTAAAVICDGTIYSNVVARQLQHEATGGVVPEVASRAHLKSILPVVNTALERANLQIHQINAIGITRGPGLMGSLLVGVTFAKSLALSLNIPLIEVHHMQAHIAAHYIDNPNMAFPFICLTVSGGHTQLVLVRDFLEMEILGQTIDDAAGEAFDKAGKMMGLPYPAGPHIDRLAKLGKPIFELPVPKVAPYSFSFSGLKTAIRVFIEKEISKDSAFLQKQQHNLCASIQHHIVDILLDKLFHAAEQYSVDTVAIAGGVSANSHLRGALQARAEENDLKYFIPKFEYCTDNAAMIAKVAELKYAAGDFSSQTLTATPRIPLLS